MTGTPGRHRSPSGPTASRHRRGALRWDPVVSCTSRQLIRCEAGSGSRARVASTAPLYSTACHASAFPVPAQADRCVNANPIVNVFSRGPHAGEVVLTYETREQNGTQGVYAEAFDDRLQRLFRVRVNPADHKPADQFLPASAIDPVTEDLWSCFYDTTGDASRTHAWYTCTVSHD